MIPFNRTLKNAGQLLGQPWKALSNNGAKLSNIKWSSHAARMMSCLRSSAQDMRQASNSTVSLARAKALNKTKQEALVRMASELSAQMDNKSTHIAGKTAVSFNLQYLMKLSDELYEKFSNSSYKKFVSESSPLIEQAIQEAHALMKDIHDHIDVDSALKDLKINQNLENFTSSTVLDKVGSRIMESVKQKFPDLEKYSVLNNFVHKQINHELLRKSYVLVKQEALTKMISRYDVEHNAKIDRPENQAHLAVKTTVSLKLQELIELTDKFYKQLSCAELVPEYPLIEQAIQDADTLIKTIHDRIRIFPALEALGIEPGTQDAKKFISLTTLEKVKTKLMDDVKKYFPDVSENPVLESFAYKQIAHALKEAHFRVLPHTEDEFKQSRVELYQAIKTSHPGKDIRKQQQEASILIVGSGPAGLWAAIEAGKEGRSVTLLEKRETFDRLGIVQVGPAYADKLLDYANQIKQINKNALINSKPIDETIKKLNDVITLPATSSMEPRTIRIPTIKTKDIQSLLTSYIDIVLGAKQSSIAPIKRITGAKIHTLDGNSQAAVVEHKDGSLSLEPFRNVIHADGASGASYAQLVNSIQAEGIDNYQGIKSEKIQYEGTVYRHQAAMYMMDAKGKTIEQKQPKEDALQKLKELGWKKIEMPKYYLVPDSSGKRVWIAGEIPENIKSTQEAEKWFNTIGKIVSDGKIDLKKKEGSVVNILGFKSRNEEKIQNTVDKLKNQREQSNLSDQKKQLLEVAIQKYERKLRKSQLNGAIFNLEPAALPYKQTAKSIGFNGVSYVIGDAAVLPNFHFGHGTTDAFKDAEAAIKSINMENRKKGAEEFHKHMKTRMEDTLEVKFGVNWEEIK